MWQMLAGAGLGALGGAFAKKPMAYQPIDQITDLGYRQEYGRGALDYLQEMGQGGKPLMSQAEIARQLSGSYGRLAAKEAAERMRIAERAMGRQGSMGGMAEASAAELGRAGLGEARQLEAGVQNQLASMTPQMRLQATGMGLGQINADQRQYADEMHRKFAQDSARQQFSKWGNILGGAVAGMGAMGGMFGNGGGSGAGGDFSLAPFTGNMATGKWQNPGQPTNAGGGYGFFGDQSQGSLGSAPRWNPSDVQRWGADSYWALPEQPALRF